MEACTETVGIWKVGPAVKAVNVIEVDWEVPSEREICESVSDKDTERIGVRELGMPEEGVIFNEDGTKYNAVAFRGAK
jgi:hypothetical protein